MSERKNSTIHEPLFHMTKRDTIHPVKAWAIRIAAIILGLLICGAVAYMFSDRLQSGKKNLLDFYRSLLVDSSFTTPRKIWKFLKNLAVLQCISLAVTPPFRMRFWNIGAEGQTLMGVWGAIAVAVYLGGKVPEWILLVLMFVAALLCGAIWAVIPAVFKAKWNTNETLFTLMMNYVATNVVAYFLMVWVPSGSSSLGKLSYGALPKLKVPDLLNKLCGGSLEGTEFFAGLKKWFPPSIESYPIIIITALLLTIFLFIYLTKSKQGYEISVVGESVRTAQYSGMNVKKVIIRTMVVSGLLCGVAGYLIGAGLDQSITTESVGGQGFTAIMVSWLAKFNPLVMLLTSGLVTLLNQGADQISTDLSIPDAVPGVIVGIILLFIIGSEFFINYRIVLRKRHVPEVAVK